MWAKEKEAQKETIKDLPKMNQVGPPAPYPTPPPSLQQTLREWPSWAFDRPPEGGFCLPQDPASQMAGTIPEGQEAGAAGPVGPCRGDSLFTVTQDP